MFELGCFSSVKEVYNLVSNDFSVDECRASRPSIEKCFVFVIKCNLHTLLSINVVNC